MPPAARITDMHVCPMVTPGVPPIPHVGGPILPPGAPTVLIGFLPAARVSDMAVCVGPPDVIAMGSTGVMINFLPAARMGDPTAHGGTIVLGEPTVMIGEIGSPSPGGGGAGGIAAGLAAAGLSNPANSGSYSADLGTPGSQGAPPPAFTPPTYAALRGPAPGSFDNSSADGSSDASSTDPAPSPDPAPAPAPQTLAYQPTSGADLTTDPDVPTTLLGSYTEDIKAILAETGAPKTITTDCDPGKFNLLNVPDEMYQNPQQFWDDFNKPWLDAAIARGDKILLCTPPLEEFLTKKDGTLTGYGREIAYLQQNGYKYDSVLKSMVK